MKAEVRIGSTGGDFELPVTRLMVSLHSYVRSGRVVDFFSDETIVPDDLSRARVIVEAGVPRLVWTALGDDQAQSFGVLLESPHKNEYELRDGRIHPIGPAQGDTGERLETHLEPLLQGFTFGVDDGEYQLVLCNPVPFQASLFHLCGFDHLCRKVRDLTWEALWRMDHVSEHFRTRLAACRTLAPRSLARG
ncbi:MAG: hypothetical protein SF028_07395 [Candidatus Sumerlaeia bacterium]|nr:hypothetical protein [Candidatus Sumerlaeia bacterium]